MTTEEILEQLREKYHRAIEKYGRQFFNEIELESRITFLLKSKGDVVGFLQGEMEFFEQCRKKAEEKIEAK